VFFHAVLVMSKTVSDNRGNDMNTLNLRSPKPFMPLGLGLAWLGVLVVALAGLVASNAKADDCSAMLKPVFDFITQPGKWDIPPRVYATVTKHIASNGNNAVRDPVQYSNGPVQYSQKPWGSGQIQAILPTLSGNLPTLSNSSNFAPGNFSLSLKVSSKGDVSVQELQFGNPVGGKNYPPSVYKGSCSSGLITIVDKNTSWVISFTTTPPQNIK
jgi:hypothetical protein